MATELRSSESRRTPPRHATRILAIVAAVLLVVLLAYGVIAQSPSTTTTASHAARRCPRLPSSSRCSSAVRWGRSWVQGWPWVSGRGGWGQGSYAASPSC
jgi:hypothetical protein